MEKPRVSVKAYRGKASQASSTLRGSGKASGASSKLGSGRKASAAVVGNRAGKCLGLALESPVAAIAAVKKGLPVSSVDSLGTSLGITSRALCEITNIADRTLARRKRDNNGRLKTDESERVLRIGLLFDRTVSVLGGLQQARQWLNTPSKALGDVTPLVFADTEPGAREVEALLGRIEYGVFS